MNEKPVSLDDVQSVFESYETQIKEALAKIIESWPADLNEYPVPRVLGALLARQTTLTIHVVGDLFFWNPHLGPLILRPLLENWLKIEWLLKSPQKRACGIARADLIGARDKLEFIISKDDPDSSKSELIDLLTNEEKLFSLDAKTLMIDSRQMAKKVGGEALNAYRRHQVWFSSCVHSTWHHIARFNLVVNPNPLHRYNFVPIWKEPDIDISFPLTAAEYCQKAFDSIQIKNADEAVSPYSVLIEDLKEMGIFKALDPDERDESDTVDVKIR